MNESNESSLHAVQNGVDELHGLVCRDGCHKRRHFFAVPQRKADSVKREPET